MSDPLAALRREIDTLDDQLIALLAARMEIAHRVAARKRELGIPVIIPERVTAVIERCAAQGVAAGLDPNYLRRLYRTIIDETCRIEQQILG